ncbi:formimidoylglutamase [Hydrogenophaga sp. A37]|uniref:formimidoylglutamase n=1 Tax=Hydrogenophaga sp. A37 TaxID=1945864 RepID=UPI00098566C0|nr:formimidoylglutamase [Hydrogenophaga sp. A37]OOG79306.1 formimidoylglutamase [Hydrogenophaga sp. A37]
MNPNPPFEWRGRIDAEETGVSTRWHQHVRPATEDSQGGVTLIGFAVDEGVRRNAGRTGAALGPQALRGALANLPVLGEPALWDAGDVSCKDGALETAQAQLGERVADAMERGSLPLVLGGGHEMAWGTFQGIVQARPDASRLLVINLDAHFDLRVAAQANSGTPFRQMHDWCTEHDQAFNYRVFGISRFANTQALFDRAHAMGVRYWLDDSLQDAAGLRDAQQALATDLARCDAVYLTVCLDVLPGAQASGVSAPAPLGVPLAHVERLIDQVLASGRVVAADIAELNPSLDRDGLTARVAARLAARMARGRH